MQKSKCNPAIKSLSALVAIAALSHVSPALALNADAAIDQISQPAAGAGWLVDQVSAVAPASSHLAQVPAPAVNPAAAFQATSSAFTAQLSMADQVPGTAGSYGAAVELAFLGYGLDLGQFVRVGQGSSFASDDRGNSQQHFWNGAENLQASLQRGSQNRSAQEQTGLRNASLIVQDGEANYAEVVQGADFGLASILQVGARNSASIYQGTNSSVALVSQAGIGNIVSIRQ